MTSRVSSDRGYFGLTKCTRHIGPRHPDSPHHSIATRQIVAEHLLQSTCCRAVVSGFSAVSAVSAAISILQSSRISMIMRVHLAVLVIALVAAQPASAQQPDPYIWLEQQTGDRAMAWVRAENAKT